MTHIAIQEALDGVAVGWMEKVTDDEYLGDHVSAADMAGLRADGVSYILPLMPTYS